MRYLSRMLAGLALVGALGLGACGTAQTDKFVAAVQNFGRGLAAVDQTVKQVNAVLYSQCTDLVATAGAINDLSGQCSKVAPYTSVANTYIDNFCQAPAAQSAGIATSLAVTARGVSAAKSTLAANKKACAT